MAARPCLQAIPSSYLLFITRGLALALVWLLLGPIPSQAQIIEAGSTHTCVILSNYQLKCWGAGGSGRLGQENTDNIGDGANEMGDNLTPIDLGTGRVAAHITAGDAHTCALLDNNTVKCWGYGASGRLGQGHTNDIGDGANEMGDNLSAVDLGTGRMALQISAGAAQTCALLDDGSVKCWGFGGGGRLGQGSTTSLGDGANEMGDNLSAIDLGTGRTATQIAAGRAHGCALLDDATLKCWGFGGSGRLGYGSTTNLGDNGGEMGDALPAVDLGTGRSATQIAAGDFHTCALLDDGSVKCWGEGDFGRLGQGTTNDIGDGANEMGDNLSAIDLGTGRTAVQIAAKDTYTCALLDDGSVKCWGQGSDGQLGQGTTDHIGDGANEMGDNLPAIDLGTGRTATRLTVGNAHTCAVLDDDTVKCWGNGASGQLGQGSTTTLGDGANEMGDNLSAIALGAGLTARPQVRDVPLTAGDANTCVVLDTGSVKCWGSGGSGRLGYGNMTTIGDEADEMGDNLSAVDLGTGRTATQISAGNAHTCAVLDNGSVKCWGSGGSGRLGYGNTTTIGDEADEMGNNLSVVDLGTGRTATQISAGGSHTCAVLDTGSVKCWGFGGSGRLGYGNTSNIGDGPSEMGDNLSAVDLGTGRTATQISAGNAHTCALLDNGSVKCWGFGGSGLLGQGNTTTIGDGANEMGDNLSAVDLGTGRTATQISAGGSHTCALLDNGSVKCWGSGGSGRLGYGNTSNIGDGPSEMGDNLSAVDLGTGRTATQISAGNAHTCALLDNGSVKCWGESNSGRLGQGTTNDIGDGPSEMGDNLSAVDLGTGRTATQISAGGSHTCAVLDTGSVKCWGSGSSGRLGYGNTDNIGDEANEMGNNLPAVDLGTGLGILPVELTHFTALLNGNRLNLRWTTASETNNSGFALQHQTPKSTWNARAFIPGHGTTTEAQAYTHTLTDLAPGTHRFRLKQIDFDGTFAYSPTTEVFIPLPDRFDLSAPYPNPFHEQTRITLHLQHAEQVRVVVYDALGRQLRVLHDGRLAAHAAHTFVFQRAALASGWYFIEVQGETIQRTQPVLLTR